MYTPEFRRHFVEFVPVDALMALRLATKGWNAAADALIDEGVRSGELMVHDGRDRIARLSVAQAERRKLVTRVVLILNITKVGDRAYWWAVNLIVVDIPEGVESIGQSTFAECKSLITVCFSTTLALIRHQAFLNCYSLENLDLLHTNLGELGDFAFSDCSELKSMRILDSLQTFESYVFGGCDKLFPSNI
ncbi:hypothetical protein TrLO_g4025, partial [Triparma laevis f. longispina]